MSDKDTAPKPAQQVTIDPLQAIIDDLARDAPRKETRAAASAIIGARAWELLPSRFKSAVRADVGRIAKAAKPDMVAAGYSELAARLALRDLGKR